MPASSHVLRKPALSLLSASVLACIVSACGGGGSSGPSISSAGSSTVAGTDTLASSSMLCPDGAGWQCSGGNILRVDNGIGMTRSGVQAYAISTNDLQPVIQDTGRAIGMAPGSGGTAEVRVKKDGNGGVSNPAVLLDKMNISWDGKTDRPIIVETFMTQAGRVELDGNRAMVFKPLPDHTDLNFWDVASKGASGTQLHYANNSYFPRSIPSRCPADVVPCPTTENANVKTQAGDWRNGGIEPDLTVAGRLHEDGDAFAGDGPTVNGQVTWITTSDGPGVPFPGAKGFRTLDTWSLRYANLSSWSTMDTVHIFEWGGDSEHNKGRRGVVAFGDTTDPNTVPTSGNATYTGVAYGWYTPNGSDDPGVFRAAATITVNFATRQASVNLANGVTFDANMKPVPVDTSATLNFGAAGQQEANYATGAAQNASLAGGVSLRFFGPVGSGGSGTGPAELAGVVSMGNGASKQFALGGFIASRR